MPSPETMSPLFPPVGPVYQQVSLASRTRPISRPKSLSHFLFAFPSQPSFPYKQLVLSNHCRGGRSDPIHHDIAVRGETLPVRCLIIVNPYLLFTKETE